MQKIKIILNLFTFRMQYYINIDFDLSSIILNTYSNHLLHKIHLEKQQYMYYFQKYILMKHLFDENRSKLC